MESTSMHCRDVTTNSSDFNRFYNLMNNKVFKIKLPKVNFDQLEIQNQKDENNNDEPYSFQFEKYHVYNI